MSESADDMERKPGDRSASLAPGNSSPARSGKGGSGKGRGGRNGRKDYGYQRQQFQGPFNSKGSQNYNRPAMKYGTVPDKKPQSRRQINSTGDLLKDEMYGITGSTSPKSYKKQSSTINLNHLLNFTFEPRQNDYMPPRPGRKTKYTPYNKEQFLQANCQFVVRDTGNYAVHTVDSDMLVDWDLIEQVSIFSHDVPSCPICLFPPTAAKITRCGHIYCWSCMLHYLSVTNNNWQKCPICFEAIHSKDLKSVVSLKTHRYARGERISLRLMQRVKGSVVAVPKPQWTDQQGKPYNITNSNIDTCFVKLLIASSEDILSQVISKEKEVLQKQLKEVISEKSGEQPFVESALAMVEAREEELMKELQNEKDIKNLVQDIEDAESEDIDNGSEDVVVSTWRTLSPKSIEGSDEFEAAFSDEETEQSNTEDTVDQVSEENITNGVESIDLTSDIDDDVASSSGFLDDASEGKATEDGEGASEMVELDADRKDAAFMCSASDDSSSTTGEDIGLMGGASGPECYYFYQADDGQNIFLHPINARCLVKEYGSLENSPEIISGTILEMEAFSQTHVIRRRYRYLSHLPLTCEFVVCELELRPPLVSRETLHEFRDVFRQRNWQRKKKAKEEKKRERKLSGTEKKPAMNLSLSSERDFPQSMTAEYSGSPENFPSPISEQQSSPDSSCNSSIASSPPASISVIDAADSFSDGMPSIPSFAQALRSSKTANPSPLKARAIESKFAEKGPELSRPKQNGSESDQEPEDYVPVPNFQSAFSAALLTADWNVSSNEAKQGGGKKQKKAKKKLLFTTSAFPKYQ